MSSPLHTGTWEKKLMQELMKMKKKKENVIEFFMPIERVPTSTHQEKKLTVRKGKPVSYESAAAKTTRKKLMAHLGPHVPKTMIRKQPVRLTAKWCYKTTAGHHNGDYRITKPDTDNLNKMLKDCMTELKFWKDDALVASEIIEKFWADLPGIYIRVEVLA